MPHDLLHKLIYALISGFTEFLGVSAPPHQMVYELMTGFEQTDVMLTLSIRVGALTAVFLSCRARIKRLMHEQRLAGLSRRRRNRQPDPAALLDIRLLKTVTIPLLISVLFYKRAGEWINGVLPLSLTLVLNGVLLFIPRLMSQGNKDGRARFFTHWWDDQRRNYARLRSELCAGHGADSVYSDAAGVTDTRYLRRVYSEADPWFCGAPDLSAAGCCQFWRCLAGDYADALSVRKGWLHRFQLL